MHTGLYAEALEVFRSIIETAQSRAAEEGGVNREALSLDIADATIKRTVLELIVQAHGIPAQKRHRKLAAAALGQYEQGGVSDAEMVARAHAAIREDALYDLAWFNRAVSLRKSGRQAEAFLSYLAAAAVRTGDDEAWVNSLFLAQRHRPDLLPSLLEYLRHQRGEAFVKYVADVARRQPNNAGRDLLSELAQGFSLMLPSPEGAILRIHRGKGAPIILKTAPQHENARQALTKQKQKTREKNKKGNRKKQVPLRSMDRGDSPAALRQAR